jgi:DNA-binding transcriptional LysR family regulator
MSDLDALADMALFVEIVERGSLSAAGRALGLPKASVSRRLAAMERRFGAPLLNRSTRSMTTTDFGRRWFERAEPVVREARAARAEAMADTAEPGGLLRVSASVAYGRAVVAPSLWRFLARWPAVRIDLRLTDARVAIVEEGVDLAIRIGALEDSALVARRLATVAVRLAASPDYLARHGTPRTVDELARHRAVLTRPDLDLWRIGGAELRPRWSASTGDMGVTRDAALAGVGVALLPGFLCDADIAAGDLVAVLPQHALPAMDVTALRPPAVAPTPAVQALLDHLTAACAKYE